MTQTSPQALNAGTDVPNKAVPMAPQQVSSAASMYSQSQKGAIIIALLGAEYARPLVESFDDKHMQNFVKSMQTLQFTPRPILLATIAEFVNGLRERNAGLHGGEKPARELAEALLSTERANRLFGAGREESTANDDNIWDKLKAEKSERIAQYLNEQRPELVSFVLSKMDSVKAGEILSELSDDMSAAAAKDMSSGVKYDKDVEKATAELLRVEFLASKQIDDGSQVAGFMADIMGVLPKARRDTLMEIIDKDNPETANMIRRGLLTFEDLPKRLPKSAIPLIFRDMDPKDLLAALKAGQETEPETVEFLFANISQRMAGQYKEQVDDLGALSEKESDTAIIALMSFISRQEKADKIEYIDVPEEDEQ